VLGAQILLCANITGDVVFEPAEQSTIDYIETHKNDLAGEDRLLRLIWGATKDPGFLRSIAGRISCAGLPCTQLPIDSVKLSEEEELALLTHSN
jgi:hypothetical protein